MSDLAQLIAYVPEDRRVDDYETVDGQYHKTVLVSDIVGFTKITDYLGSRLIQDYLSNMYSRLIPLVYEQQGVVISFSGDGMLCLFDTPAQGQACAAAMHAAVAQPYRYLISQPEMLVTTLKEVTTQLKIGLATGTVNRYLVGDSDIQVFDVVSGEAVSHAYRALERCAAGETFIYGTS